MVYECFGFFFFVRQNVQFSWASDENILECEALDLKKKELRETTSDVS